ncbi:MAG TPA: POTRA domain-containing protein [Blastocatellia bacterium]|jgi:outer membrane protein insertion porin family|nr:POTRA domain-containing protein [Blastocatellia bacterium]
MWKRLTLGLFVSLFLLTGLRVMAQQNPETQTYRLNKVDVNGLQKISREKFLEVSGLRLGQSLKFADLKTATNKLSESGLFAFVRYRYSWDGDNLDVIFDVEESKPPEPSPAPAASKTSVLGKIEFSGLQHCDQATAANALGLQLGAVFDQKQLNAASKRLGDTGYFSDINFSYREVDGQMVARFEVTEFEWDISCVFDNFVWFTPQELRDAVRKQIPGFEGSVADHVVFPKKIKAALEELLRSRGIQREVDFIIGVRDLDAQGSRIQKQLVFVSTGAPMPVCNVSFPGASASLGKQMQAELKPIMNIEYSGQQFAQSIENTLLPIYRRRGYLQAKFGDVSAQPDAGANKKCKGGVNVSAQVVEGAVYKLGKFEWVGNQALEMETIQDLFRMKTGVTADGAKIDKGLNAIKTAYLKQGYLDLKMTVETNFDESAGVANYHIVVEEGKPYQMGEVLIKNASGDEEKRIRSKWQMAQGAVFNMEYIKGFIKKMFDDRSGRTPRVRLQPDRAKQIANVLFTF